MEGRQGRLCQGLAGSRRQCEPAGQSFECQPRDTLPLFEEVWIGKEVRRKIVRLRRKPWVDEAIHEFDAFVISKDQEIGEEKKGQWSEIFASIWYCTQRFKT